MEAPTLGELKKAFGGRPAASSGNIHVGAGSTYIDIAENSTSGSKNR
jgi:hypothetical protein